MAADMPAGPPPTTSTSLRDATGTDTSGRRTRSPSSFMGMSRFRSMHRSRLPAHDPAFEHRDGEEEAAGEDRAHDDRRIQQRRVEVVGGLDDQRADALRGADPFADDGADHRRGGGD